MRAHSAQLEKGLGDFLRSVGMQQAADFAPIREPATCDYLDPADLIATDGKEAKECGRPAAYAHLVLEEYRFCREHALKWQEGEPPPAPPRRGR